MVGRVEAVASITVAEVTVARLIERLGPRGDWAAQSTYDDLGYAVHCLLVEQDLADRPAAALRGRAVKRPGDYASQREFSLGLEAHKAISAVLVGYPVRKS